MWGGRALSDTGAHNGHTYLCWPNVLIIAREHRKVQGEQRMRELSFPRKPPGFGLEAVNPLKE